MRSSPSARRSSSPRPACLIRLTQVLDKKPVYDGRLVVREIQHDWDLKAELVTLSACETARGRFAGGEGFIGFTQSLLMSGARSVCLSLWKVDDTATALLMRRFYANLLGGAGGARPQPKAEALAEAKAWLRGLSRAEAEALATDLSEGEARGKGAPLRRPAPGRAARCDRGPALRPPILLGGLRPDRRPRLTPSPSASSSDCPGDAPGRWVRLALEGRHGGTTNSPIGAGLRQDGGLLVPSLAAFYSAIAVCSRFHVTIRPCFRPCCGVNTPCAAFAMVRWPNGCTVRDPKTPRNGAGDPGK